MRRAIPLGTLFALACVSIVVAIPASGQPKLWDGWKPYEATYLTTYVKCWDAFKDQCGRNIVDDGLDSGKAPSQGRVESSIATMDRWLNPPEPAVASSISSDAAPPTPAPASVAPSAAAPSTVQCESGGDYAANTGNGYYGGYQFDSGTWDAYGDPAYGEASEAPPAVQDAAAASVPYDAWPNC